MRRLTGRRLQRARRRLFALRPVCEGCNQRPSVERHHIIRVADGGTDEPANILALCLRCHREITARQQRVATGKAPDVDLQGRPIDLAAAGRPIGAPTGREGVGRATSKPLAAIPTTPPEWDTTDARAWWDRVTQVGGEAGLLSVTDEAYLDLFTKTLARLAQLDAMCGEQGIIIEDAQTGKPSEAPWYKAYCTERVQAQKLFAAGGFTPEARKRIMGQAVLETPRGIDITRGVTRGKA